MIGLTEGIGNERETKGARDVVVGLAVSLSKV